MREDFSMSDNNINTKDFVIGTLVGSIIGASAALLLAPKSGKELRGDINEGAIQVKYRANDWKEKAYTTGSEFRKKAMDTTSDLTSAVKEKTDEVRESAMNLAGEAKEKGQHLKQQATEKAQELKSNAAKKAEDVKQTAETKVDEQKAKLENEEVLDVIEDAAKAIKNDKAPKKTASAPKKEQAKK